ncbi:MAG: hypothetical protein JWQ66_3884 [Mucilaginibacter sp.]|nr:hypothetical protein [Mucilaginibacter sp.]
MKTLLLSIILVSLTVTTYAQGGTVRTYQVNSAAPLALADSAKIIVEGTNAYYQKSVKVDTGIGVSLIYIRALQFMAAKNFQQNYGYEEEGKLIFTTSQDLNTNIVTNGYDMENVDVFTVQFAITIDMKKQKYRYTIHNVVFFRPTESGNRRLTLYDMYQKETNGDSRGVKKDAKKVIDAFEKYIGTLTNDLYESIQHKAAIYNSKF